VEPTDGPFNSAKFGYQNDGTRRLQEGTVGTMAKRGGGVGLFGGCAPGGLGYSVYV